MTRRIARDPGLWRKAARFPATLTNIVAEPASATTLAQLKQLTADVVGGPNRKVVGKVHAQYADGEFTYRLEWTGDKADVQELGWAIHMPKNCDRFSWDRAARWTVYPDHHIGRPTGTATPDPINVPYTRMDRTDAFDFNSTKYDCNWASLADKVGAGLRVEFAAKQRFHCRAGVAEGTQGYVLFVNQQVCPPDDLSKPVARFGSTITKNRTQPMQVALRQSGRQSHATALLEAKAGAPLPVEQPEGRPKDR